MRATQRNLAFIFGVGFVVVLLVLAPFFPRPSPFQYLVFRIVLALAAAGVAAMLPGFLHAQVHGAVKAGGALAVFVVVYYFNPASLVTSDPMSPPVRPEAPPLNAAANVDCARDNDGACTILISVENHGRGAIDITGFRYRVLDFRDLGGTLGPAVVPEEVGDLELSGQTAPTPAGSWAPVHTRKVQPLSHDESATVAYRVTAKDLGKTFGFWTLEAQLHTSAGDFPLGTLQLMLPYWEVKLLPRGPRK
jgi:hypothetical protein